MIRHCCRGTQRLCWRYAHWQLLKTASQLRQTTKSRHVSDLLRAQIIWLSKNRFKKVARNILNLSYRGSGPRIITVGLAHTLTASRHRGNGAARASGCRACSGSLRLFGATLSSERDLGSGAFNVSEQAAHVSSFVLGSHLRPQKAASHLPDILDLGSQQTHPLYAWNYRSLSGDEYVCYVRLPPGGVLSTRHQPP